MKLAEDATADVQAFRVADDIKGQLIRYLLRARKVDHYGFRAFRFSNGEQFLCLRGADIGLDGDAAKLWFRFGIMDGYAPHGSFSMFKNSGERVITCLCLHDLFDTDTARDIIVHNGTVHDVLLHELTHYIESVTTNRDLLAQENPETGSPEYFNAPHEMNAYYVNLATPLFTFLRAAEHSQDSNGLARMAAGLGITRSFPDNVRMMFRRARWRANGATIRHWLTSLTPERRKALLRRLHALHQHVVAVLDRAEGAAS